VADKDDHLTARIEALHGGKPPAKILARREERRFEQMLRARRLDREKRGRAASKRIEKVRAPLIRQLMGNPKFAAAYEAFKNEKIVSRPPKKIWRRIPIVKSDIRSGSILTFVGPPYDFTVGWAEGPGVHDHDANTSDGRFSTLATGGTGYTDDVAGVGMFFSPIKDCVLRVSAYTPYDWDYQLLGGFATAHADGYFGWLITNATDQIDVYNSFDQIFSNGVSWFDNEEADGSSFYQASPLVFLQSSKWYRVNLFCQLSVDDGFDSSATAQISAQAGFFVFEQFL
jgi:hypothetical protein